MALFKTGQLLIKNIYKTEVVFNEIKKNIPISKVVDKYLAKICSEHSNVTDLLKFPPRTFYKLDKKTLKNIIRGTYNIVKMKSGRDPVVYDNLMSSYLFYKIEFDINEVVKDMVKYKVDFDENIYSKFIKYHSNNGEMSAVENLLNEIKRKNIELSLINKFIISSGYIIAGQPEQAESFIKEHDLNMESKEMLYSRCYGYASIADVASLKNLLAEMKERNVIFSPRKYFILYYKLISAGVDDSNLNEVIDLTKADLVYFSFHLCNLITILISADYFRHSVFIMRKLIDLIENPVIYIDTFASSICPIETLTEALTMLLPRFTSFPYDKNIFVNLDFDTAFIISEKFAKIENWKVIYVSLIRQAINARSKPFIVRALKLSCKNLLWWQINELLQHVFLPSMLTDKMVSTPDQLLYLLPTFKKQILPVVLMKYLCTGDFTRYNQLISKEKIMRKRVAALDCKHLANDIENNLTMKEVSNWLVEARKYFDARLINNILTHLLINKMLKLSNNDSTNEIKELIDYAKKWNIELSQANFRNLINSVPKHSDLIRYSIEKNASAS